MVSWSATGSFFTKWATPKAEAAVARITLQGAPSPETLEALKGLPRIFAAGVPSL